MTATTVNFTKGQNPLSFTLDIDETRSNHRAVYNFLSKGAYYEADVVFFMRNVLKPGDACVDVGANMGVHAMMMGTVIGPSGRMLCFEPDPINLADLRRNITLNGFDQRVQLVPKIASRAKGMTEFWQNSTDSGGSALWDPGQWPADRAGPKDIKPISVETTTVDAELEAFNFGRIKAMKIDTEGAEQLVLEGTRAALARGAIDFIVCEFHSFGLNQLGFSQHTLRQYMANFGYDCFVLGLRGGLPQFVPPGVTIGTKVIVNLLFTKAHLLSAYWERAEFDVFSF